MITTGPASVLFSAYPFIGEIASQPPELIDIVKGLSTRITTVINEGNIDEMDEGIDQEINTTGLVDFWTVAALSEIELYLTVSLIINKNHNMISRCELKCYVKLSEKYQQKWLDIFNGHVDFFSSNEGYGEGNIVIGLCRPVGFKKELEAFLNGESSKTPAEIKQMFEDFLNREPFGLPSNLKPELEAILNDFLTCVENIARINAGYDDLYG